MTGTKRTVVSVASGAVITCLLFVACQFTATDLLSKIAFWPALLLLYLFSPKGINWQITLAALGVLLSAPFYASLTYAALWLHSRRMHSH